MIYEKFILIPITLHSRDFDSGYANALCWSKYWGLSVSGLYFRIQTLDRQTAFGSERCEEQERQPLVEISILVT